MNWRIPLLWLVQMLSYLVPEPVMARLLPYDARPLRESFNRFVRPRIGEYSPLFYTQFFADYPEVVPLFGRNMVRPELDTRINHFMLFIVDNATKPQAYMPFVRELARRHRGYGISRHQYDYVCETNIKVLKQMCGDAWNPGLEHAWRVSFGILAKLMKWNGGFSDRITSRH